MDTNSPSNEAETPRVPEKLGELEGFGRGVWLLVGTWLVSAAAALGALLVYGNTPGATHTVPETWPNPEQVRLDSEQPTLLMFAHPKCPCTRASVRELERVVAQTSSNLTGHVLFYEPRGVEPDWGATDLRRTAEAIPGIEVHTDPGGDLARAFGCVTSGHTLLFSPSGCLVFSGGLTASRGHEGDNRGRDAIRHFINEGELLERETPVFGCDLVSANLAALGS